MQDVAENSTSLASNEMQVDEEGRPSFAPAKANVPHECILFFGLGILILL